MQRLRRGQGGSRKDNCSKSLRKIAGRLENPLPKKESKEILMIQSPTVLLFLFLKAHFFHN
jgi:hypothetical protein